MPIRRLPFAARWFAATPLCDAEDIYELLLAIIPAFRVLAYRAWAQLEASNSSDPMLNFYLHIKVSLVNLEVALSIWNPTERLYKFSSDESDFQTTFSDLLQELECRCEPLERSDVQSVCKRWRPECRENEVYSKLRGLKRILPKDDTELEKVIDDLDQAIRFDSGSISERNMLLQSLNQAVCFIHDRQRLEVNPASSCPIRFTDYPLKRASHLSKMMFEAVQKNWCCSCSGNSSHTDRKIRLNLTENQRFEMAPVKGQYGFHSSAHYRVLFPTSSLRGSEWQDTEIAVDNRDLERVKRHHATDRICQIIQEVGYRVRPKMAVFEQGLFEHELWELVSDIERKDRRSQLEDNDFKSLRELLSKSAGHQESLLSSVGSRDRVILCFVLATSLVHFIRGPWLQASLDGDSICFLISPSQKVPDITKPYLTTRCSSLKPREPPQKLNQPHQFPEILSLGITLLEIMRGAQIEVQKSQDRCVVALDYMDDWEKTSKADRSKTTPEELYQAISACINPAKFKNSLLDNMSVTDFEVRKYIFEKVLYPLEKALSTAYDIQSDALHSEISQEKGGVAGSFDHHDEGSQEKQEAAHVWLAHLEGLHSLFYECNGKCDSYPGLSGLDKRATRVKIAVLDTGLQLPEMLRESYEERMNVEQSEDFVSIKEPGSKPGWTVDNDGHGSRIGQIILDFAPAADLHVAKVFDTRDDLANENLTDQVHKRIIEAINRATNEWHVDMIVMCFGFDEPIRLIREAIDKASKGKSPPLFFAATRNDGAHKRMAWPAKDRSVIGISSTDGYGTASSFNPSEEDEESILYAFGEGVPIKDVAPHNPGKFITNYVSGTSYATPVAAALAASLLGCVRMRFATSLPDDKFQRIPEDLQGLRGMLAVLKHSMQKEHYGTRSLLPWDFLNVRRFHGDKILQDIADVLAMHG